MVGLGAVATVVTLKRGEAAAIPATLGFFTAMEALQVAGYWVIDDCGTSTNQTVTLLSYLHIAVQPIFINAFAMAIVAVPVSPTMRRAVYSLAALASVLIMLRLVPFEWAGQCAPGFGVCGPQMCTVSGNWHLAWEVPLNDMWGSIGLPLREIIPLDPYVLASFGLPLIYGAWRLVVFHALLGPLLAMWLTENPNEMPAIWCLFSVGIILVSLSPLIRVRVFGARQSDQPDLHASD